jgi:hypothetical protein
MPKHKYVNNNDELELKLNLLPSIKEVAVRLMVHSNNTSLMANMEAAL